MIFHLEDVSRDRDSEGRCCQKAAGGVGEWRKQLENNPDDEKAGLCQELLRQKEHYNRVAKCVNWVRLLQAARHGAVKCEFLIEEKAQDTALSDVHCLLG